MNQFRVRASSSGRELLMEKGLRAASLLLSYHVCRFLVACRADLSFFHDQVLRSLSRCARAEALGLYDGSLREAVEIDEQDLRRSAVGLARLRMLGRPAEGQVLEQEILSRAVTFRCAV
jgi:hypothetical protein